LLQAAPAVAARPEPVSGTHFFDTGFEPAVSSSGRFVAFAGGPANTGSSNPQVFVRDRVRRTTRLVSVARTGGEPDSQSLFPAISSSGRYVAFESDADDIVASDLNAANDVFVRDRTAGTTTLVSVGPGGVRANGSSGSASISANGRVVAFQSFATNLGGPDSSTTTHDIFVRDLDAGTTTRVSIGLGGAEPNGESSAPAVSRDGRTVVFYSNASNLVSGDTNGKRDVFAFDRASGAIRRVSVTPSGEEANGDVASPTPPATNANGTVFAFATFASNLLGGTPTGDVAVRDETHNTVERISTGAEVDNVYEEAESIGPSMSADARLVAYATPNQQLPGYLGIEGMGIYLRDRTSGALTRASQLSQCRGADGINGYPSLSSDGRWIAFQSNAINLLKPGVYPGGANPPMHLYIASTRAPSGTEVCRLSVRPRTIHTRTGGNIRIVLSKRGSFRIRIYRKRGHKLRRRATITGRGLGPNLVTIPFNGRIHGQTLAAGTYVAVANGSARGVSWKRFTFKIRRP
jgi:Tol biopolymer transport system component